jgi:outer membrane lipoprotein SlyB
MKHTIPLLLIAVLLMSGCARRISQNYYSSASVGEASHTYRGTIVSARKVNVGEAERLQDNTTGTAVGAITGGVAGSQIGQGSGSVLAAAGGALLGGIAGAFVEDELSKQTAMEYSVQLDNGQMMTVVQGDEEVYQVSQRVLVIVSKQGRSRIIPDQSAAAPPVYRAPPVYSGTPGQQASLVSTQQAAQQQSTIPVRATSLPQGTSSAAQQRQFYVPQDGVYYVNSN